MVNVWSKRSMIFLAILTLAGCAGQSSEEDVVLEGKDGVAVCPRRTVYR